MRSLTLAAFVAGLVFVALCVAAGPGVCISDLRRGCGAVEAARWQAGAVMLNSILFVLGFTAVFLALGAVASAIGQLIRQHIALLSKVAGAVIVLLGLHQTGALPIRALYADKRFHAMPTGTAGARAFLVGSAFGFGWTPCVGPILAVILTFAAAESTLAKGILLLAVYAVGLALPFLLTAFSIEGFLAFYARFQRPLAQSGNHQWRGHDDNRCPHLHWASGDAQQFDR